MAIVVRLDVMLAQRKMKARQLAQEIGITEPNLSLLKSGKVKGMRFDTLERILATCASTTLARRRTTPAPTDRPLPLFHRPARGGHPRPGFPTSL